MARQRRCRSHHGRWGSFLHPQRSWIATTEKSGPPLLTGGRIGCGSRTRLPRLWQCGGTSRHVSHTQMVGDVVGQATRGVLVVNKTDPWLGARLPQVEPAQQQWPRTWQRNEPLCRQSVWLGGLLVQCVVEALVVVSVCGLRLWVGKMRCDNIRAFTINSGEHRLKTCLQASECAPKVLMFIRQVF